MKPVNMIVKHDPDNGSWGDCTRACVASVFELPADQVPHFCEFGEEPVGVDGMLPWERRLRTWLSERGYGVIHMQVNEPAGHWPAEGMQFHYLRGGRTRRGTMHDTVYFGQTLVHDPQFKDPVGILPDSYPQWYLIFVKL